MSKKHFGTCQLTGMKGRFVESHLIPKALTRPEKPGIPFTQSGKGQRPVRRWSSWADKNLVIRDGEDILKELDTWAIPILRFHCLIWSGWNTAKQLPAPQTFLDTEKRGFRRIEGIDSQKLRVFFLSLPWRAAASKISEMSEIEINYDDLKHLSSLVRNKDPGELSFYPVCLTQLSTLGRVHNFSPIAQIKTISSLEKNDENIQMPIFRFYFDGLIAHIHCHSKDNGYTNSLRELVVGASNTIAVATVPYEISFQAENLHRLMKEAETRFPDLVDKLAWPPL